MGYYGFHATLSSAFYWKSFAWLLFVQYALKIGISHSPPYDLRRYFVFSATREARLFIPRPKYIRLIAAMKIPPTSKEIRVSGLIAIPTSTQARKTSVA